MQRPFIPGLEDDDVAVGSARQLGVERENGSWPDPGPGRPWAALAGRPNGLLRPDSLFFSKTIFLFSFFSATTLETKLIQN